MIATVLSGVLAAVLAFIFDLHALVEMMSIGTLLAYTIVAVCVLILRYQPGTIGLVKQPKNPEESLHPPIDGENTSRESLLSGDEVFRNHSSPSERSGWLAQITTCVSCIISAGLSAMIIWGSQDIVQAKWWAIIIVVLMGLGLIGTVIVLLWLPQNKTPLAFKVPFVPILPQVSIFINIFLILKLSYLTWVRFAVWMVIGEFNISGCIIIFPSVPHFSKCTAFFKCAAFFQVSRIFPSVPHFSECAAFFQACHIFPTVPQFLCFSYLNAN